MNNSIKNRYNLFLSIFTPKEKKKLIWVLILSFFVAILELIGIASMMPFFSIVSNPNLIETNKYLSWGFNYFNFPNAKSYMLCLGVLVIFMIISSNCIKGYSAYINNRFIGDIRQSLQSRLITNYIFQPYRFFLEKNSSELSKIIWSDVEFVISYIFTPFIQIVSNSVLLLSIIFFIAIVQIKTALALLVVIIVLLILFVLFVKKRTKNAAHERGEAAKQSFVVLNEIFGGVKDIKVYNKEISFIEKFKSHSKSYGSLWAKSATISQAPKFILETIAFAILVSMTLVILFTYNDIQYVLPILGLYTFAAYKAIPAVQVIFQGIASFKQGWPSLKQIHNDLMLAIDPQNLIIYSQQTLLFKKAITIDCVSFSYNKNSATVLNAIKTQIVKNSTVGIVGGTGAGKTTLVDLLLGLHKPSSGKLLIDDVQIDDNNLFKWKNIIGYVPQNIFLRDASIAENIAFGEDWSTLDIEQVKRVAKIASLDDFIVNDLDEQYHTVVGERGVRLSGGQRQRLGIARALYRNPEILILDEATSALDNLTESYIIKALEMLTGKCTVIIVAHRFSTIKKCDKILVFKDGQIVDEGTYEALQSFSSEFKKLSLID
jgi:ABC-type multidrug transport system fused ATPase/permease subunit